VVAAVLLAFLAPNSQTDAIKLNALDLVVCQEDSPTSLHFSPRRCNTEIGKRLHQYEPVGRGDCPLPQESRIDRPILGSPASGADARAEPSCQWPADFSGHAT